MNRNWHSLITDCDFAGTALLFSLTVLGDVFVGLQDGTVHLLNTRTKICRAVLRGHRRPVHHMAANAAADLLVTTSSDSICVWNMTNWHRVCILMGHPYGAVTSHFLPEGNIIISMFKDGTIWLWETATRRVLHRPTLPIKGLSAPCTAADCSPNGMILVTGTAAPVLFMWRIRRGSGPQALSALQQIIHLPESAGSAAQIKFTGDSQTVAVLCSDGGLRFVDVVAGTLCYEICTLAERDTYVKFSLAADGTYAALITAARKMYLCDLRSVRANAADAGNLELLARTPACDISPDMLGLTGRAPSRTKHVVPRTQRKLSAELFTGTRSMHAELTSESMQSYLKLHRSFPDKHRLLNWQHFLHVPRNASAFQELSSLGIHPAFAHLSANDTGGNARLARQLQRVLSALVFWQPGLTFSRALPRLALPFVRLCGGNTFACFEVLATIIRNWAPATMNVHCGHDTRQQKAIAYLLQLHDRQLYLNLTQGPGGFHGFMQPIVSTLLIEIFPQSHWLQVWDVLVANSPKLFSFLVVALLIVQRHLLSTASQEVNLHISSCLSHVDVDKVLRLAINMQKQRPEQETVLMPLPQCSSYTCTIYLPLGRLGTRLSAPFHRDVKILRACCVKTYEWQVEYCGLAE